MLTVSLFAVLLLLSSLDLIFPFDIFYLDAPKTLLLLRIPRNAVFELHRTSTENIQCTSNGQINLTIAKLLDRVQVLQAPAAPSIRHWDAAPRGQFLHELVVDTLLEALVIGGVDEEFGAVRLEERYRLCKASISFALLSRNCNTYPG